MDTKKPVRTKSGSAIIEKVEKLVLWQRVAILVGLLVVLFGAAIWLLYLPKYDESTELDQKLQALEKKLATAKINAAELEKFQAKMQEAEAQFKIAMRALPEKEEIPSLLTNVSKSGQDVGLEFLDYRRLVIATLADLTGESLVAAPDPFDAMQSMRPFARVSAALRTLCLDLIRICNDLRLLASGPRTGLAEISLPAVQPGSSIMPGKANPVMAEMLSMVCFQVIGHDVTIAMAAQAGQLELNVMMPVIAHALLQSLDILAAGVAAFTGRCVVGIQADAERCRRYAQESLALVTALSPRIGYDRAAAVATEAWTSGRSVCEVAVAQGLLTPTEIGELLDPRRLTEPG